MTNAPVAREAEPRPGARPRSVEGDDGPSLFLSTAKVLSNLALLLEGQRIVDLLLDHQVLRRNGAHRTVGQAIAQEWDNRKRLAPGVTTPAIDDLIARAARAGASAAKVCGAGGGGCLFCLADPRHVAAVREALADGGARLLDFRIEKTGLEVTQE